MTAPTTTLDKFLGGRIVLEQPASGYRAGSDAVMLAAACPAQPGARVLDLGCGVGAAMFCLAARVAGAVLTGVELQPDYAALARANALRNGLEAEVIEADLSALPPDLRQRSFDHVIANPPYFDARAGTQASDAGRAIAFGGDTPLAAWVDAAIKRLAIGGSLTIIQRADRLPDLMQALDARIGAVHLLPLQAHPGRAPDRILLHGRKGRKAPFRLLAPLIIHENSPGSAKNAPFRPEIDAVQRLGRALPVDWQE